MTGEVRTGTGAGGILGDTVTGSPFILSESEAEGLCVSRPPVGTELVSAPTVGVVVGGDVSGAGQTHGHEFCGGSVVSHGVGLSVSAGMDASKVGEAVTGDKVGDTVGGLDK